MPLRRPFPSDSSTTICLHFSPPACALPSHPAHHFVIDHPGTFTRTNFNDFVPSTQDMQRRLEREDSYVWKIEKDRRNVLGLFDDTTSAFTWAENQEEIQSQQLVLWPGFETVPQEPEGAFQPSRYTVVYRLHLSVPHSFATMSIVRMLLWM
jgi:hypothetical protein